MIWIVVGFLLFILVDIWMFYLRPRPPDWGGRYAERLKRLNEERDQ